MSVSDVGSALVTGASSGIGLELARIHAKKGGDLVLVARSKDKLQQIKQEFERQYNISVMVITADLSDAKSAQKIFTATEIAGVQVDTLINNAGFGGHDPFHERPLKTEQAMMTVNTVSLVSLTHFYIPGMIARGGGQILNVSSVAAFMPGPMQAVYFATKAFVNSFSQAIAYELKPHNVTVTALCPGAVATQFAKTANMEDVAIFQQAKSAESVAQCGYRAMESGQLVAFNSAKLNFFSRCVVPLLPRQTVLKISKKLMDKQA
jgi:uncharacterized protein